MKWCPTCERFFEAPCLQCPPIKMSRGLLAPVDCDRLHCGDTIGPCENCPRKAAA